VSRCQCPCSTDPCERLAPPLVPTSAMLRLGSVRIYLCCEHFTGATRATGVGPVEQKIRRFAYVQRGGERSQQSSINVALCLHLIRIPTFCSYLMALRLQTTRSMISPCDLSHIEVLFVKVHVFVLLLFATLPECSQNQTAISDTLRLLSYF
jgi:hypothetical protein